MNDGLILQFVRAVPIKKVEKNIALKNELKKQQKLVAQQSVTLSSRITEQPS